MRLGVTMHVTASTGLSIAPGRVVSYHAVCCGVMCVCVCVVSCVSCVCGECCGFRRTDGGGAYRSRVRPQWRPCR
jgi:hypothetical protein